MLRPRTCLLIASGLLLALVAFEACLQVVAFVVWRGNRPRAVAGTNDAAPRILCVGDSYTFGLGAPEPAEQSYPAQLQRRLDERAPGRWRVVSDAWPGRNSRELLLRLPAQLERHRPEVVLVLIGMNDLWRPTPVVTDAELRAQARDDGFPVRWRTARLAQLVVQWLRGDAPRRPADEVGFLGTWVAADGTEFTFFEDGRLLFPPNVWEWRTAGDSIVLAEKDRELTRLAWRREGELLVVEGGKWDAPLTLRRGTTSPEILRQASEAPPGATVPSGSTDARAGDERPIDVATKAMGRPELEAKRAVLETHLGQVVRLCREHGAEPLLLTYPWRVHGVAGVAKAAALGSGARLIEVEPHFDDLLESMPSDALYIPDGHCTARGYAEMATVVADALQAK